MYKGLHQDVPFITQSEGTSWAKQVIRLVPINDYGVLADYLDQILADHSVTDADIADLINRENMFVIVKEGAARPFLEELRARLTTDRQYQ
jgi:hypothetical protein